MWYVKNEFWVDIVLIYNILFQVESVEGHDEESSNLDVVFRTSSLKILEHDHTVIYNVWDEVSLATIFGSADKLLYFSEILYFTGKNLIILRELHDEVFFGLDVDTGIYLAVSSTIYGFAYLIFIQQNWIVYAFETFAMRVDDKRFFLLFGALLFIHY